MNDFLIYPTIDLFLYTLREGLGDSAEQIERHRYDFWRKIYHDLTEFDSIKLNKKLKEQGVTEEDSESLYVELFGSKRFREFESYLDGRYYPVQIGDTYALLVDCSGHKAIQPYPSRSVDELADIKSQIEQQVQEGGTEIFTSSNELGRTWFVWGQLIDNQSSSEETARKCYAQVSAFDSSWSRDLTGVGKLLGADIYELWQSSEDTDSHAHILICLFPASHPIDEICDGISGIYFDLLRLLCFRHKILWAHRQTQHLRNILKKDFAVIKMLANQSSARISSSNLPVLRDDLKNALEVLARYSPNLTALYYQGRTIAINTANYRKRIEKISNTALQTDLEFQTEFLEVIAPQYQREIEIDSERFERGLGLLQDLMEANRGRIDLYQAVRDRRFEQVVAIAGVGLATSQIAAAIITLKDPPSPEVPVIASPAFWKSLTIGIIFGAVVWGLIVASQRLRNR